jgi:hypothetical protein
VKTVDIIYAWIATEPNGDEGICSTQVDLPDLGPSHIPLIGADRERVESLRPYAEMVRLGTGYPVRLVRFLVKETLEVLS